ncbi:MAG: DUF4905 domain-containing protein [Cyclobacteriaceae bacterium]
MDSVSFRFSLKFDSTIWKLLVDAYSDRMILEMRDLDSQSIHFEELKLSTGAPNSFQIKSADLWTSIVAYQYPVLLLEQFSDPQNPNSKHLLIYDVALGKMVRSVEGLQFTLVKNGILYGSDLSTRKESQIDLGLPLSEAAVKMESPVFFSKDADNAQSIVDYLELESLALGFEYFEGHNCIIICYYERFGTNFDRTLVLIRNDEEILRRKIDQGMTGYAPGSFFIYGNMLIFIENRNQLNAIEL